MYNFDLRYNEMFFCVDHMDVLYQKVNDIAISIRKFLKNNIFIYVREISFNNDIKKEKILGT